MSNRNSDMGDMAAINRKLAGKYDAYAEKEVLDWIKELTGDSVTPGMASAKAALMNGQILVKLAAKVYEGTANLPEAAKKIHRPIKFNTMSAPFKQMENIQCFLNCAGAYGVPKGSLFQTVDLHEGRNMVQVINTILQLGTECQRHGYNGPTCGPKPTTENKREFTQEQINESKKIIGLQAGSNKGASQSGMAMGGVRHIADIQVEEMSKEGQSTIGLQAGSNKGASQSGMNMGGIRHISDIKVDEMSKEGQSTIGLQAGSNKGASQSGMSMGGIRHVSDIKVDKMSDEAQGIVGLQAGSNKGASQSGMNMGGIRHISDIKVDDMSDAGKGTIGLQAGSNQGASQSGMSMGAQRHIADIKVDDMSAAGKGTIGLQSGSNQGASQSGMSMGSIRHVTDSY